MVASSGQTVGQYEDNGDSIVLSLAGEDENLIPVSYTHLVKIIISSWSARMVPVTLTLTLTRKEQMQPKLKQ